MQRTDRIMDYRIVKVKKPIQYSVRFMLAGGGRTGLTRLKRADGTRIQPTVPTFDQEPDDLKADCRIAVLQVLQDRLDNDQMIASRKGYDSCREAMEMYLDWHSKNRSDKTVKHKAKSFIDFYGDKSLSYLNRNTARDFIENLIAQGYSYDTVRLRVAVASSMISWLEDRGQWHTRNPFIGLIRKYSKKFKALPPANSMISDQEYEALWKTAQGERYKGVRLFIEIARCTGLRVTEIMRLNVDHLDKENLTWDVLVTKTKGREFYRKIAVPRYLVTFLINEGITSGKMEFPGLRKLFLEMSRECESENKITLKTFRKDFAHRMEKAGATEHVINLHQGRAQHGVLYEHYLTDPGRAARLCRPFINTMFGEKAVIERVK